METNSLSVHPARDKYCGLLCLYIYAQANDLTVEIDTILKPERISAPLGSTLDDLLQAAQAIGVSAIAIKRLTFEQLAKFSSPAILHVKKDITYSSTYDHYVLYLSESKGIVSIVDPSNGFQKIPNYRLAERWNGVGLILGNANTPTELRKSFHIHYSTFIAVSVLVFLWGIKFTGTKSKTQFRISIFFRERAKISADQLVVLVPIILLVSLVFHTLSPYGLLAYDDSGAQIIRRYFGTFARTISKSEVTGIVHERTALIIDARNPDAFAAGHISDAINIPPTMTLAQIRNFLSTTHPEERIVIYCQSSSCPFSDTLSRKLIGLGYSNLFVFPGGWSEWTI